MEAKSVKKRTRNRDKPTKFLEPQTEIRSLEREAVELREHLRRAQNVGQIAMRDAMQAHTFAEALGYGASCANAFLKAGHKTSAILVLDAIRCATVEDLRGKVATEMAAIDAAARGPDR